MSDRTAEVAAHGLNYVMDFDHVVQVHADGRVTDTDTYAPELYAEEGVTPEVDGWTLLTGYTGQYSYSGPIMHNSEFIGGRLADDILAQPGQYVALVCTWLDVPEGEDNIEGWAVAYKETLEV